jgi:hypothetical protein
MEGPEIGHQAEWNEISLTEHRCRAVKKELDRSAAKLCVLQCV